jgi:uncharacterized membrane protein
MDDSILILILRLVHVLGGTLWASWVVIAAVFVLPIVLASGPEGGRFMQGLMSRRLTPVMTTAMIAALVSGFWLYVVIPGGLSWGWVTSGMGLVLGLGGLAAVGGALVGVFISIPSAKRMGEIGRAVQASGGPPSPEQAGELAGLRQRLRTGAMAGSTLLIAATAAMAIARYV